MTEECDSECEWSEDDDGIWNSACGLAWVIEAGSPEENEMNYCPKCGKRLVVQPPLPSSNEQEA